MGRSGRQALGCLTSIGARAASCRATERGNSCEPAALRLSEVVGLTYNGPEWVPAADGVYIAYTKFLPGRPRTLVNARLAIARQLADGTWEPRILQPELARNAPYASNDPGDPSPRITYVDPGSQPFLAGHRPAGRRGKDCDVPQTPKSVRFVNGARAAVFVAAAFGVQQVFRYDLNTKQLDPLTFDDGDKDIETVPWMWAAPGTEQQARPDDRRQPQPASVLQAPAVAPRRFGLAPPFDQREFPTGATVWSPEPFVPGSVVCLHGLGRASEQLFVGDLVREPERVTVHASAGRPHAVQGPHATPRPSSPN